MDIIYDTYKTFISCATNKSLPEKIYQKNKNAFRFKNRVYIDLVENVTGTLVFPRPVTVGELSLQQVTCSMCSYDDEKHDVRETQVFVINNIVI